MAQIVDHRDLLTAYQPGNMPASERIVRVYQNELLRSAFLLSGSAEGSVLLARDATLGYFRQLLRGDAGDDPRFDLLCQLGNTFLTEPDEDDANNGDRPPAELTGTIAFEGERQRYHVDDQRSRTLESLALLERSTRSALVLRDFNGLDEEQVCRILDDEPFGLRQKLHPARDRLRDAANAGPEQSVRELLVNAATSAPRPNLWPEVIGPLEEIYAREDARRQRYTYAAAGFVALLFVVAGLWLFDVFPFGSNDGGQAAALSTATPTATPEPTITPTPVPELSSFAIPQGDVPDQMLMQVGIVDGGSFSFDFGAFDPDQRTFTSYGLAQDLGVTPDGRYLIGLPTGTTDPDQDDPALVAVDLETGQHVWEAPISPRLRALTLSRDNLYYIAAEIIDSAEVPTLIKLDLETGKESGRWPDLIPSLRTFVTNDIRIFLRVSPDNTRLFVLLQEFGGGPTNVSSSTLASYSLPDMTFESSNIQTDSTANRPFPVNFSFFETFVTPDSNYIYRVDDEGIVQFRSSKPNEDRDVSLPFSQNRPDNERLIWLHSNDGGYLYVVTAERRQVAIVDLLTRRVSSSFPLAFAYEPASLQDEFMDQVEVASGLGMTAALSHDGNRLYLAGSTDEGVSSGVVSESVIWTIDVDTWTVTGSAKVPGRILMVSGFDNDLVVRTMLQDVTEGRSTRLLKLDLETGEVLDEYSGDGLPDDAGNFYARTLTSLYQLTYGRTPAVDHVAPADVSAESTLPRITAFASSNTPAAGSTVQFAVRALNPVDGQLQVEQSPEVRFDLDSTIVLRLIHEEGAADDIILIPNATEQSLYRASATILQTGVWDAEVTVTAPDGESWSMRFNDMFEVVPSWEASDGRRYVLRVQADPSEPRRDEVVTVIARFVDVETGRPLPDDARILEAFPDELQVVFDAESSGPRSATLTLNAEGIYEGEIAFPEIDTWEATINLPFVPARIQAGVTNVVREDN